MKYLSQRYLKSLADLQSQTGFAQFELLLVILLAGIIPTTVTSIIALNHPTFQQNKLESIARKF